MKLELGQERVIVRGIRPEEQLWGAYQFPIPYVLEDRILVGVHITIDDIRTYGATNRWFESTDLGRTWREVDAETAENQIGVKLPNGDIVSLPMESAFPLDGYRLTPYKYWTPGYDMTRQAEEGTLPIPDGVTSWMGGTDIFAYNADRLPPSLAKRQWLVKRLLPGQKQAQMEYAELDWPWLTRVVHTQKGSVPVMKAISPRGYLRLGPDGALWVTAFSGEGHLNPLNGQYSPYYSAELFRSEDNAHSFQQVAHMEYEADGHHYPYASGGFSDSDIAFMPDGSMVWFFRSNWYGSTGQEWSPMYWSRSTDFGRTWEKPRVFAPYGTLPRLARLDCGTVLVCYARPGMFISASLNASGTQWSEPLMVETPGDRSHLANVVRTPPTFHDWDGACNNPEIVPIGENKALFFYSDFYYPDEHGVKRKTILCREITVRD
ncbi:MAG: hypothetical protein ACOX9E_04325 [Lentisphaeria bacterium]|jgi:hypothetical protein